MILRYIIFILTGFLLYHLIKKLLSPAPPQREIKEEASEMVLDQNCGRYVLKRDALKLNKDGVDLFFCSDECMQNYKRKTLRY
jgi:YHS domain-containing protein